MSAQIKAMEDALFAALTLPTPVAARVARGDAFPLPTQDADGALIRVTGARSIDALTEDESLATIRAVLDLNCLGPIDTSAAVALEPLITAAHARLMADKSLGGIARWIALEESEAISFETQSGGEEPVHSCTIRYQIHSNFNPQTLGA